MNNSLEIDFLPVGDGESSGDAIAFRYGDFNELGRQHVIVIDGGTAESGKQMVNHLKKYYGSFIDLAILTHPDEDHSSGLREILNGIDVGELWMHKPWDHSEEINNLFADGRITDDSLSERLKDAYNLAYEIEQIANSKDIPIREPFAGRTFHNGVLTIMGPTEDYYEYLIPHFTKSPEPKSQLQKVFTGVKAAISWVKETIDIETLSEDGETSAENNSSVITLLDLDTKKYLFTGDAGIEAMNNIIKYSDIAVIDLSNIELMQAPHHGSHRNVSPNILDSIKCKTAYVSASKNAPKHPSKKVVNAFIRRDSVVYSTEGNIICHRENCPQREGYSSANPLPFYEQVEE